MTYFGLLSSIFFLSWAIIFLGYSIWIFHEKHIQDDVYRTLWIINLGSGLGILLFNYEIERFLQTYIDHLPLSLSSVRAFVGNILIMLPYYVALKKMDKFPFPNWIFPLIWGYSMVIVLIDFLTGFLIDIPYREFQVWMSLLIVPFSLASAIFISPMVSVILNDERSNTNRARFLWWLAELMMTTLSAFLHLIDALYRVAFADYRLYTIATILGISFYMMAIISALCRIVFPQYLIEFVLYPEKIWSYYRLRRLCKYLHRLVKLPELYRYQTYFYPSLHNLDREIYRSINSISDVSRLLSDEHALIKKDLLALRNPELTPQQTIDSLLKIRISK
ncbi:MAG: hypothetical protein WBC91_13235 [Phototrophicaceae bacterium]